VGQETEKEGERPVAASGGTHSEIKVRRGRWGEGVVGEGGHGWPVRGREGRGEGY